jgi:hypothetical protein
MSVIKRTNIKLWNEDGWKLKYSEKQLCLCHSVHLTMTGLGSNTGLRGVRTATDRLNRGTGPNGMRPSDWLLIQQHGANRTSVLRRRR